jgi:hypothetical protein
MRPSPAERKTLEAFRRAAAQIREASIVADDIRVEIKVIPDQFGGADVYLQLLQTEPFRSLAMAVRLVYQTREPANLQRVCNALGRRGDVAIRAQSAELKQEFLSLLRDPSYEVHVADGESPSSYSPKEAFEYWLNGIAFHQDFDHEPHVRRLLAEGPFFLRSVQEVTTRIAMIVLKVDGLVAAVLGTSGDL